MKKIKTAVLVSGGGTNLQALIDYKKEERHYIVDVMDLIDRDEKAGVFLKITDNTAEMREIEKALYVSLDI